ARGDTPAPFLGETGEDEREAPRERRYEECFGTDIAREREEPRARQERRPRDEAAARAEELGAQPGRRRYSGEGAERGNRRRPRPGRARGPASKRLPDRREHPALDRLVLGRERLVRVYPEDAFALEDAALHRDRRSVPPLGLEVDPQPVPRALGVDAVVLAVELARVGGEPADGAIVLVDLPAQDVEHLLGGGPRAVERYREGLRGRPRVGGRDQRHERDQHERDDLHA